MTIQESVIYLASCAVNGEVPEKNLIGEMDLEKVYDLAKKHKVACCVAMALESAGYKDAATAKVIARAMRRDALFAASFKEVTGKLEEAGIWYVPLKGIVLKNYYPQSFMREMADHDILFDKDRQEDVREIMEGLGFTTVHYGAGVHDVYMRKPVLNYEMHRELFGSAHAESLYRYYQGAKDLSKPEDFYLYTVAHEFKHFSAGGTGLRSLLDTYLYLRKEHLDWNYVEREAAKIGIAEFEQKNRALAIALFGAQKVTDEQMLSYMMSSYAYGTHTHYVDNRIRENGGGRIRYILMRLSVPIRESDRRYQAYASQYPLFYKCKILLPLLPLYRTARAAAAGRFAPEWKAIWKKNSEEKHP